MGDPSLKAAPPPPSQGDGDGAAQQRDHLCGPFCVARILGEEGIEAVGGEAIDQDAIAVLAGSTLPDQSEAADVPPGASSLTGYRHELPSVPAPEAGTAPDALAEAIEQAGGGEIRCLLVHGSWDETAVEGIVGAAPELGARLIANLQTGKLWSSRAPATALSAELLGREPADEPAPDWDVGHFVELTGLLRGPGGTLVAVRDTYPTLGWGGSHLQPPRAIAAALNRDDGRQGGLFVISRSGAVGEAEALAASQFEALVEQLGLEFGPWDNGTRRRSA